MVSKLIRSYRGSLLARNASWMFFGQGLRLIIQAVYFTVIARSLGTANYGAFVGVVALVGVLFPFATLGMGCVLIKNVAREPKQFSRYWGKALVTTVAGASVLFGVAVFASRFVLPGAIPLSLVMLIAAADLGGMSLASVCWQAFQAFEQLNWTAAINVMVTLSRLLAAVALVSVHQHPSALEWGKFYFGSTVAAAAIAMVLTIVKLGPPSFKFGRRPSEAVEGFYFSASLSAQTIYNDIDKTMLARLGTLEATGIYGAAYRLIDVSFTPISALLAAAYPNFFRAGIDGIGATVRYAKPLFRKALSYAVLVSMIMLLSAGVVPYVLGPEYKLTVEALRWLSILPILKVTHYFFSDALTGAGYQALRSGIQVGVAIFNVLINFWLIPAYSWRGAAWSSLASDGLLACAIGMAVIVISRRSQHAAVDAKRLEVRVA